MRTNLLSKHLVKQCPTGGHRRAERGSPAGQRFSSGRTESSTAYWRALAASSSRIRAFENFARHEPTPDCPTNGVRPGRSRAFTTSHDAENLISFGVSLTHPLRSIASSDGMLGNLPGLTVGRASTELRIDGASQFDRHDGFTAPWTSMPEAGTPAWNIPADRALLGRNSSRQ